MCRSRRHRARTWTVAAAMILLAGGGGARGALAQGAQPKVKIDAPGGALEVREGSGDVQRWLTERAVNQPEVVHFRWKTQRSDAVSATWVVMVGSPSSRVVGSGPAGAAPPPGQLRFFVADLRSVLPPRPPAAPSDYWVALDVDLKDGRKIRSFPVKLTYRKPSDTVTKFTDEGLDKPLEPIVESVRNAFGVPAMGAAVIRKNGTIKVGVSGIRRHGYQTRVAPNDRWHIGSDTKAMTATLAAILVDRGGVIGWQTTLAEAFPELSGGMNAAYRTIKLIELLRHRGGIPEGHAGQDDVLKKEDESNRTRRYLFTEAVTANAPSHVPGKFVYSNAGYIIAAAMLEKRANRDWEEMMRTELFQPLGAPNMGFGPPETQIVSPAPGAAPALPLQPWGHRPTMEVWDGKRFPAAAPAGDVHASLRDWGRFILLHLNGQQGTLKLSPGSISQLHSPYVTYNPKDSTKYDVAYAAGWGTDLKGSYGHDGCITWWYARVTFHMIQGYGVLVTANMADQECEGVVKAVNALETRLMQYMGY